MTLLGIWTWNGAKPYKVPTFFVTTNLAILRVPLIGMATILTAVLHLPRPVGKLLTRQIGTLPTLALVNL